MSDVILTAEQYEALKTVCERASDLVTALPYVTMMGGNITRQNIAVQALATALDAAKGIDFENVREFDAMSTLRAPRALSDQFVEALSDIPPVFWTDEGSKNLAENMTTKRNKDTANSVLLDNKAKPRATALNKRTRSTKG